MSEPIQIVNDQSVSLAIEALMDGQSRILELLSSQPEAAQQWYTPTEFAKAIGRSPYTVRSWLNQCRLKGRKRSVGRGKNLEWEIHKSELDHYKNHGRKKQVAD